CPRPGCVPVERAGRSLSPARPPPFDTVHRRSTNACPTFVSRPRRQAHPPPRFANHRHAAQRDPRPARTTTRRPRRRVPCPRAVLLPPAHLPHPLIALSSRFRPIPSMRGPVRTALAGPRVFVHPSLRGAMFTPGNTGLGKRRQSPGMIGGQKEVLPHER